MRPMMMKAMIPMKSFSLRGGRVWPRTEEK
jgi:hypothetical protein